MRAAVGYKSVIGTCLGINMVGILSVGEVSPLARFTHPPNSVRKIQKMHIHIPNCKVFTRKEEL